MDCVGENPVCKISYPATKLDDLCIRSISIKLRIPLTRSFSRIKDELKYRCGSFDVCIDNKTLTNTYALVCNLYLSRIVNISRIFWYSNDIPAAEHPDAKLIYALCLRPSYQSMK